MVASSVTGLYNDGVGSVDGKNKGSERMTLHSSHLLGVKVVAGGNATLSGGTKTVTFAQPLDGDKSHYVVMLTNVTAAAAMYVSATTNNSDGDFASFAITGTGTNSINWIVVKIA